MTMRERFADGEWSTLERLPVLVFLQVAIADGSLEDEESATFVAEMLDAPNWRDPLMRELLASLSDTDRFAATFHTAMEKTASGANTVLGELEAGKTILRDKVTENEYQRFVWSLMGLARRIGDAHVEQQKKKGLFHRKPKEQPATSAAEAEVIGLLGLVFQVDPTTAMAGFAELQAEGSGAPRV